MVGPATPKEAYLQKNKNLWHILFMNSQQTIQRIGLNLIHGHNNSIQLKIICLEIIFQRYNNIILFFSLTS